MGFRNRNIIRIGNKTNKVKQFFNPLQIVKKFTRGKPRVKIEPFAKRIAVSSRNKSYNRSNFIRESHNCYSYFLNLKSNSAYELCKLELNNNKICRRSQPGYASNYPRLKTKDFNCPVIMKRTLDDNKLPGNKGVFRIKKNQTCPATHYKGALVVAPKRDYHYYRLNDEKVWTHKPGYKPVQFVDSNNNIITDPETAGRNYGSLNNSDFCGFMCVPRDPSKKKMSMKAKKYNS